MVFGFAAGCTNIGIFDPLLVPHVIRLAIPVTFLDVSPQQSAEEILMHFEYSWWLCLVIVIVVSAVYIRIQATCTCINF